MDIFYHYVYQEKKILKGSDDGVYLDSISKF
jgi:hypothetical protein